MISCIKLHIFKEAMSCCIYSTLIYGIIMVLCKTYDYSTFEYISLLL